MKLFLFQNPNKIWAWPTRRPERMERVQAISIGEVLWDLVGDAEHLGGAPFNFAVHLGNLEHSVHFVSAVGDDQRGRKVLERMGALGLSARYVRQLQGQPTGTASVILEGVGQPHFVINHPAAYDFPELSRDELGELCSLPPDLIYFGTLFQMSAQARQLTMKVLEECQPLYRFYDVNLRAGSYDLDLVQELMSRANVVKVNDDEVATITSLFATPVDSLEHFCRFYAEKFHWKAVCVTRGAQGCVLLIDDDFIGSAGYSVKVADTIGAGDAFSAAFAHGLNAGWEPSRVADFANRVGALVASRSGATPSWSLEEVSAL